MTQDVRLRLSVSGQAQVVSGLGEAERGLDRLGLSAGGAGAQMRALAAAFGIGLSIKGAIDAADAVTNLHNSLRLATGSAQAAGAAYEKLFSIAQSSRTAFIDLGNTFASISRAAQSLGLQQSRLLTVTEAIGNAMTISGGSAAGMQAALQQLGQGLASGTLRGDELNSVLEQTPRLAQALADGLGVGIGELRKLGEAGSLTAEKVIGALERSAPQLAKEVQGATLTVGQAFTVLTNSAVKFTGDADKATGATNALAGAMRSLAGAIDTAGEFIRKHETAFGIIGGTLAGAAAAAGIAAVAGSLKLVAGAVGALGIALAANPVVLTLLGIGAVVGAVAAGTNAARSSMAGMAGEIESLTQRIATAQKQLDATGSRGELTAGLEARLKAMRDRRAELQQTMAALQAGGLDTRAEDARFAASTAQYAARTAAEKAYLEVRQKLSGVDKDYLPTLEVLQRAREHGIIGEKEYIAQVTKLAEQTYKKTDADKAGESAAKQNAERVKSLTEAVDARVAAGALELQMLRDHDGTQSQLTKAQEYALDVLEKLRTGEVKLTTAQAARLAVKLEQLDADERAAQQIERDAKWSQQAAEENARFVEQQQAKADALREQVKQQEQQNEAIGLTTGQVARLEAARLLDAAAEKERIAAMVEGSPLAVAALNEQAQALRDLAAAKIQGADKQTLADANKEFLAGIKGAIDQAGQSLTDALMRGGKGAGEQLRNYFKTLAVRMTVQALVVNPLQSALGVADAARAGGSSLLSAAGSAGSLFSAGSALGSLGAFGSSLSAGTAMTMSGFGGTMAALEGGAAMLGSATGLSSAVAGIGQIAGALGPYALAIGALVAIAGALDDSGTPHLGGAYQMGTDGTGGMKATSATVAQFGTNFSLANASYNGSRSASIDAAVEALVTGVAGTLGQTFAAFGLDNATVLGRFRSDNTDASTGALQIVGADGTLLADMKRGDYKASAKKGLEQFAADAAVVIRDVLVAADLPSWADKLLTDLGDKPATDALNKVVTEINAIAAASKALAPALGITQEQFAALAQQLGGAANLSAVASAYVDAIYTDAQKMDVARASLASAFIELGVAMPSSKAAFKQLVEVQDISTEAGLKTHATLMGLAGAFGEFVSSMEQAGQSVRDEIARLRGATGDSTAAGMAALQAQFAVTTAQARAGDADALARLPELSQAVEAATATTAATALDAARTRAWLANSLETTLGVKVPAFATGGDHAGGLRLVGERGPELEITGPARYYSAAQTQQMLAGGDQSALLAELRAVRAELQALRTDGQTGVAAVVRSTARAGAVLERVLAPQRDAIKTRAATD